MYENVIVWAALGLLFILCLPLGGIQRFLLAIYGLALRLGMLGLIAAATYVWYHPDRLPAQIADAVRNSWLLNEILPDPGSAIFAICAVSLIALFVLPLIAILDNCRRAINRTVEKIVVKPIPAEAPTVASASRQIPAIQIQTQSPSRFGRRAAANAMAQAGSPR